MLTILMTIRAWEMVILVNSEEGRGMALGESSDCCLPTPVPLNCLKIYSYLISIIKKY